MTTNNNSRNSQRERMVAGAVRYANANPSDPFAFGRALTHIKNGVVGLRPSGDEALYDAKPMVVTRRLPHGRTFTNGQDTYQAVEFIDQKVP